MSSPMRYVELEPAPELRPWIASIWTFECSPQMEPTQHHIPLTGGAILCVGPGRELLLAGERTSPLVTTVTGGDIYWGVHFWPAAAAAFLGLSSADTREWLGPARLRLTLDWCARWRVVIDRGCDTDILQRIENLLYELVPKARPLDPVVMTAVFRIVHCAGSETVAHTATAVGLSPRQLRRRFASEASLTPKELARVRKVRRIAESAATGSDRWIELASRGGYADQSHLVREFGAVLGLSPEGFRAHAERIAHRLIK
jgi:AraC-like DNA-binding protein